MRNPPGLGHYIQNINQMEAALSSL
jgi:hypothetical protein